MNKNLPKAKMSYPDWCKLTKKDHGLTILKRSPIYEGHCELNIETDPTPNEAGYKCIEVFYRWLPKLSDDENMKIFWDRVKQRI